LETKVVVCEIEAVFDMIGGKWKPLILYLLHSDGRKRTGEIKKYLRKISQKSLTNQLRELELDGFINKHIYPEVPPRVEYELTKKGASVVPILDAMCVWFENNSSERYQFIRSLCDE
jgi:DNA-binding HxlR family transcriptional regulator